MKVALVHDYLVQDGGAERVLLALHELFPNAPIFTLFHDKTTTHPGLAGADIRPSTLNKKPFAPRHYQWYLPLMPQAIETLDLSEFNLVISNSSSFGKGVIASPHALHIGYCHTPTRFLWQERIGYVNDLPQPKLVKWLLPHFLHRLRQWDRLAAERPDILLTNSQISRSRIKRYYQRDAHVIYPPVDVEKIPLSTQPGETWLSGGRLVAYKRFDLIVRAFAKLNLPLIVFGDGPELPRLKLLAGPRTTFVGRVDEATKLNLYQRCHAFIHPQVEDFGITAVEAMAAGKPVIAYKQGGAKETVIHGQTGIHLEVQCWEDIAETVRRFDEYTFDPAVIRAHAEQFSHQRFLQEMRVFIDDACKTHGLCTVS
jgi:glycosyltransferase involved in cell wall biosynthesis